MVQIAPVSRASTLPPEQSECRSSGRLGEKDEDAADDASAAFDDVELDAHTDACTGDVPTNVESSPQMDGLPGTYLSGDSKRPLRSEDEFGVEYDFFLRPMFHSVIYILLLALLERFTYYGILSTQINYLMGVYSPEWNAAMTSVQASTYISTSQAMFAIGPFLGGIVSDCLFGEYRTILLSLVLLYIPGVLLIALTAMPDFMGDTFNLGALTAGMLVMYPLGAGIIRSVVAVFGAKQYHPNLQSAFVDTYYVNMYVCINVGGLLGGVLVPIVAQSNAFAAFMTPLGTLMVGCAVFLCRTAYYVRMRPNGRALLDALRALLLSLTCWSRGGNEHGGIKAAPPGLEKVKESNGGNYDDSFVEGVRRLLYVCPITALIIPFKIAYYQMTTTFIVQGTVMQPSGVIDAAVIFNTNPISVLIFGFVVAHILYPALAKRKIRIATTHKFAIGSFCGALASLCAVIIDHQIHAVYEATGGKISIFWLVFPIAFIGLGEIFAISPSFEVAFVIVPPQHKSLASAINFLTSGALPSFICIGLYNSLSSWFEDDQGSTDIKNLEQYSQTRLYNYFWVLFGINMFDTLLNSFPQIRSWVTNTEETSRKASRGNMENNVVSVSDCGYDPS